MDFRREAELPILRVSLETYESGLKMGSIPFYCSFYLPAHPGKEVKKKYWKVGAVCKM